MHMYIVILKLQPVKCVYKKSYCHQQHYILFLEVYFMSAPRITTFGLCLLSLLCFTSQSNMRKNHGWPVVMILDTDQNHCGL